MVVSNFFFFSFVLNNDFIAQHEQRRNKRIMVWPHL